MTKARDTANLMADGAIGADELASTLDLSGKTLTLPAGTALPSQSGQNGNFLTTDGSSASWSAVDALPSQTGQNGKYLTTDGTTASWDVIDTSAAGNDTELQYNNAGARAGASGLVTDGSNLTIKTQGDIRFGDADDSNYVGFQAPATVAADKIWTLPDADGTNGQVLATNGSGTLSWQSGLTPGAFGDGSVSSPSITFSSDANTGIYRIGADNIGFTAGGNRWLNTQYTLSNIPVTENGVGTSEQQFMAIGKNANLLTSSGSAAILNIDQTANGNLINRIPFGVKISGGGRGDNTGYTAPDENGLLAVYPEGWGGNSVQWRNAVYVRNRPPYFMVPSVGIKVFSTHYAGGIGIDSIVKADDPNGGGSPAALRGQVDNSNTAYDNSAPVCLELNNGPSDNISKNNGGATLARFYDRRSGSTSRPAILFYRNTTGNQVGSITTTSSATTYSTSSDYRLKENVVTFQDGLSTIGQLRPVSFDWKVGGSSVGFIAHELQEVVPFAVTGVKDAYEIKTLTNENGELLLNEDGSAQTEVDLEKPIYQGVDSSFLVPHLVAAVQELKGIIDTQASTITALEARITSLEAA